MESQMKLSRYVFGCSLTGITPVSEPEQPPTIDDILPNDISDQIDLQIANNQSNGMAVEFNIHDVSIIDGEEF